MQFSADENLHFLGCSSGKSGDREYYRINVGAEDGSTVRLYTDPVVFGRCKSLKWGDEITPVISLFEGRSGIGATLVDFIVPTFV